MVYGLPGVFNEHILYMYIVSSPYPYISHPWIQLTQIKNNQGKKSQKV